MEETSSILSEYFLGHNTEHFWFCFWKDYTTKTKQQLGDDFTAAMELSNEEDIDAALLALDRIVDKGSDGYVTMAKLKKASILIEKGERDKGLRYT